MTWTTASVQLNRKKSLRVFTANMDYYHITFYWNVYVQRTLQAVADGSLEISPKGKCCTISIPTQTKMKENQTV